MTLQKPIGLPRRSAPPLLPNLFSRLTDNAPHQSSELPSAYTLTIEGLHDEIRRDLAHLLNASSLGELIDAFDYPLAARSCINFGMPPLAGESLHPSQLDMLGLLVNEAVNRYEPRLMPDSVTLHWCTDPESSGRQRSTAARRGTDQAPRIEIRALLKSQVYPVAFTVQSAVDFATQRLTVLDPA